jgi:hypothetical protein
MNPGLHDRDSIINKDRDFSLRHRVQTYSVTGGCSPGVKRLGSEDGRYSGPFRLRLRTRGAIPPLLHISSWHDSQLIKDINVPLRNLHTVKFRISLLPQNLRLRDLSGFK